jgi:fibronectin type 3 domain-containing protein
LQITKSVPEAEVCFAIVSKKDKKKKKKTALVICRDRKEFWTTQAQFWQWVREGIVVKTDDKPLTGTFSREHEELMVLVSNTVLNLAHPNHMREALLSRRLGISGK